MREAEVEPWRLVRGDSEERADGSRQMAVDEVLLDRLARGLGSPSLRFYRFRLPTLSLGRHQPPGAADHAWCGRQGIDLVRRPTGGGAVLHETDDLTYALAAPLGPDGVGPGVREVSRSVARALARGLRELGVEVELAEGGRLPGPAETVACYARPSRDELLWHGRKLVGSAQVRRRRAFLQHGSVPLRLDPERQRRATGYQGALPAVSLTEAAGRALDPREVAEALLRGLEAEIGRTFAVGRLDPVESLQIEKLRAERYLDAAWTLEGGRPHRESA